VQGSTIIGLEHHTPVPGGRLYQEMAKQGRLRSNLDYADIHGQFKFTSSMV
jgi:hypothetical protein